MVDAGDAPVLCTSCGFENPGGSKFCGRCGARLALTCPACGQANPPGGAFCNECGTRLPAAAAAGSEPAPGAGPAAQAAPAVAERRLVSVLFADLVGFTALSEGQDAEETRVLLSRYFAVAQEVIGRYGGTVEKFIGDAVMAVWGAPVAREDDAERAVRAGLDLVDEVGSLGPAIHARVGILTGEAAVTVGATNQGLVAGDLVNTASRLQSAAPRDTVLVGESTYRAASKAIAFEAAGEHLLKGKASPVAAWRALRVVAEVGGRNRAEALEPPFVGRDDELRLLKELFHATSREKRARLVSVIGPAGIGKTRLAWEFLKYLDGLVETVWFHEGRSPSYGDGITFWALGEMVRRRAGLAETDDERTTRVRIAATLAEHVPDAAEREWIEPALLALLGIETGVRAEQLFGAWRAFFERLAASAPVVMVFEDFHHADSGLIDFVDHLLEWSRGVPLYVVTLSRPELFERREHWGADTRNFTSLHLEPLPDGAMHRLLEGLVPELPEPARRSIVARADGIPLYAVEFIRMLIASGRVVLDDGVYRPAGPLTDLAVPETLTALIASRLDDLPPGDRALVSDAAVLGQSFTLAGLAAVAAVDEGRLETRLRALVRREILAVQADPRSPERGQYAFVQGLTREVAYNMLARGDRKTRHLAAARFFESLGSDELAGAQAGHYLVAYRYAASPDEADALAAQARVGLRAAAERAIGLGAHDQAVRFLSSALEVTHDAPDRAQLSLVAATSAEAAGMSDVAERLFDDVIASARAERSWPLLADALTGRGRIQVNLMLLDQAIAWLRAAIDELREQAGDRELGELHAELARAYSLHGEAKAAIATADVALELSGRARDAVAVAQALITKSTGLSAEGRGYESVATLVGALHLAERRGLVAVELRARNNLAGNLTLDDPRAARELVQVGLERARRLGQSAWAAVLTRILVWIGFWLGDWDGALAAIDDAEQRDPADDIWGALEGTRAAVLSGRGDRDGAHRAGLTSIRRTASVSNPTNRAYAEDFMPAWAAFCEGDYAAAHRGALAATTRSWETVDDAFPLAGRAAALARDAGSLEAAVQGMAATGLVGMRPEAALTELEGCRAALGGRRSEAVRLFTAAATTYRQLGLEVDLALLAIERISLLGVSSPEAADAAEEAGRILTRLRAQPLLDRLRAATADATHGGTRPARRPDELTGQAAQEPSSRAPA